MVSTNVQRLAAALPITIMILLAAIETGENYPKPVEAQSEGEEKEVEDQSVLSQIAKVNSIYQGKEYSTLTPYFMKDGQRSIELGFPKLPDNFQPEMVVEEGQSITMEFEDNPVQVQAFLTDYDADVPVRYPLEETSKNSFRVTPEGIKTLEVLATFPGNKQVTYSTLVDVVETTQR